MDMLEDLLCPQVTMLEEDTPLDLDVNMNDSPGSPVETDIINLPEELRMRMLLEDYEFEPAQVPNDLRPEDMKYFSVSADGALEYSKIHCTACHKHLGSHPVNHFDRYVHPLLQVLLCKNCYTFYNSGEYSKDEDGSELYCRWCGQGGKVLCCSECAYVFCSKCIRYNVGLKAFNAIKASDDWKCFVCNPDQLIKQRVNCWYLHKYILKAIKSAKESQSLSALKLDKTNCCNVNASSKRHKVDEENEDLSYNPRDEHKDALLPKAKRTRIFKSPAKFTGILKNVLSQNKAIPPPIVIPKQKTSSTIPIANSALNHQTLNKMFLVQSNNNVQQNGVGGGTFRFTSNIGPIMNTTPLTVPGFLIPMSTTGNTTGNNTVRVTKPPPSSDWFNKNVKFMYEATRVLNRDVLEAHKAMGEARTPSLKADVHNKLQKSLSTAIQGLIRVRKSLRKDFIEEMQKSNTKLILYDSKGGQALPTNIKMVKNVKLQPIVKSKPSTSKPAPQTIDLCGEEAANSPEKNRDPLSFDPPIGADFLPPLVPFKKYVIKRKVAELSKSEPYEVDSYNKCMKQISGPLSVRRMHYARNLQNIVNKNRKTRISQQIKKRLSEVDFMKALNVKVMLKRCPAPEKSNVQLTQEKEKIVENIVEHEEHEDEEEHEAEEEEEEDVNEEDAFLSNLDKVN